MKENENSKRVRDTSLWKFTGYACSIKVSFSPCVMTGAVLAMKQIINIIHFLKNKTIDKQLNICLNVHMRNGREKWNDPIK